MLRGLLLFRSKGRLVLCQDFFCVTSAPVSNVTHYLVTGVSPMMPTVRGFAVWLQAQTAHTGTHNTEPAQSLIQAFTSPRYVNTHAQRLERAYSRL